MAIGYFIRQGDKASCGGSVLGASSSMIHHGLTLARAGDSVSCGKEKGIFKILSGIGNYTDDGICVAGTLDSVSSCPCRAKFYASEFSSTYEKMAYKAVSKVEPEQHAQAAKTKSNQSSYVTGDQPTTGYVSDYPAALINTKKIPDDKVIQILKNNSTTVMLLTLGECFEFTAAWGAFKTGWVSITHSEPGEILVSYGLNYRDVINTSIMLKKLGGFGITATVYINEKGTELIKISGHPGIRKILNAPVFKVKNPKIIENGIGRLGVRNSIIEGAKLTIIFVSVYRTIDYILNDETTLAMFIGNLATDIVKIGINSAIVWGVGEATLALTTVAAFPIVAVVVLGLGVAWILNELDKEYGVTDRVVSYISSAQQEFAIKARGIDKGIWDLGSMYADKMLEEGREFVEYEIDKYLRDKINKLIPRIK